MAEKPKPTQPYGMGTHILNLFNHCLKSDDAKLGVLQEILDNYEWAEVAIANVLTNWDVEDVISLIPQGRMDKWLEDNEYERDRNFYKDYET